MVWIWNEPLDCVHVQVSRKQDKSLRGEMNWILMNTVNRLSLNNEWCKCFYEWVKTGHSRILNITIVYTILYIVRPTNVQLRMGTSTTLSWDLPALGGYFNLANFTAVWKESSDSEGWTPISTVDCHQTHVSIDTTQLLTSSRYVYVAVQANYRDGRCITSEEHRLDMHKGNSIHSC